MKYNSPNLFIKIDSTEINFIVGEINEQNNIKLLDKIILPIIGVSDSQIFNLEKITDQIQRSILLIEQKIKFTFKDLILILGDFDISFLNLTGYKKLNGSQISKENVTYIINSLKSCIDELEKKNKILHIFNSKFLLDKKKIENIPIGLFGDFYSHELSFNMIKKNDFKNLKLIFDNCNINIKKIISNTFVKGTIISDKNPDIESFFHIQFNENNSKIFYVENGSIKFEQSFKFGTKIISKDITKITSLNLDMINKVIENNPYTNIISENELIEQKYFINQPYRKIKKSSIMEIAEARINELLEILLYKNINLKHFLNDAEVIFLEIDDQKNLNCFKNIYINCLSLKNKPQVKILKKPELEDLVNAAYKITQYGWKKEVIPVTKETGSFFSRFFRSLFS